MDDLEIIILPDGTIEFEKQALFELKEILQENISDKQKKLELDLFFEEAKLIRKLNENNDMFNGKVYCG